MICEICNWKFWSKSYVDSRRPMVIASIQVWQEMTRNQAEVIIWNFWKGGKSFVKRGRIKAALCWQTRPSMVMTSGGKEVIIWRRGVKLGPFFRTLAVWQKRAKSFLFHARAFEVGMGGGKKRSDLLRFLLFCFFAFLLCALSSKNIYCQLPTWASWAKEKGYKGILAKKADTQNILCGHIWRNKILLHFQHIAT